MRTKSGIDELIAWKKAGRDFFIRDVLEVAPALLSCVLVIRQNDNVVRRYQITETEAYRGEEDKACHASKGRTQRTEVMYREGGKLYVYLVYGMHWMLNVVTGEVDNPQAVLIRGIGNCTGPGKVTKTLGIDRSYNGEDLISSGRIWLEITDLKPDFKTGSRIGVDYAGEYWKTKPWRFYCQ